MANMSADRQNNGRADATANAHFRVHGAQR